MLLSGPHLSVGGGRQSCAHRGRFMGFSNEDLAFQLFILYSSLCLGLSRWLSGNPECSFDPWVGTIPGGRKCQLLQYSCLGNPIDRGVWLQLMGSQGVGCNWAHTIHCAMALWKASAATCSRNSVFQPKWLLFWKPCIAFQSHCIPFCLVLLQAHPHLHHCISQAPTRKQKHTDYLKTEEI